MNYLKTPLFLVGTALLGNLQAATFIPIHGNSSILPNITHQLNNLNNVSSNTFLTNEVIRLGYTLNVAAGQVGKTATLFVVGKYNDRYYALNANDQWTSWDQSNTLPPYRTKTLAKTEQINVLKSSPLPTGEFLIYLGYQITGEDSVFYSQVPASLAIFGKTDPALHRIKNKEVLTEFFDRGQMSPERVPPGATGSTGPTSTTVSGLAGDASKNTPISQTNIQEVGVDESDRIKAQNDLLYTLQTCSKTNANECLKLYRMTASPAETTLLGNLNLENHGYQNGMLYLPTTDADTPAQELIYINDSMSYPIYSFWRYPWYWQDNKTEIKFIDVSQPTALKIKQTVTINSALISSRIVNNVLYLVTRKNPSYSYPHPLEPVVVQTVSDSLPNSQAPDVVILPDTTPPAKDIDNILPTIAFDSGDPSPLVKASECYLPASSSEKMLDNTLITITAIPLKAPKSYYSVCVAGSVDTFYMSTKALYLASSRYPYQYSGNSIIYNQPQELVTEIHKFTLAPDALVYKGSGSVLGHLGWEIDKQPFRMGENNDILKVATSLGDTWSNNSKTRVTVFQEDTANKSLKEIASIDNLGKPGERLYAARFIENRGYLVTFRVTDPLYVLDFTEPTKPEVVGELNINGYSDYLHPIGDKYLLGIGKDAVPDATGDPNFLGAWYQGVKIALYDVSSKDTLKEVDSLVIGKRGTESAALQDHHALAWLASGDLATLAIPIELHNNRYPDNYFGTNYDYSKPNSYFDWTHTGLYTFTIDTGSKPKITFERRLIANTNNPNQYGNYAGASTYNDRAVIQGSSVHYLHDNRILSTSLAP